jgi:hypothetical protein
MPAPTPTSLAKSHTEEAEQTALFCWASLPETQAQFPQLKWMFAIPNGGLRDRITAGKLKAAGVKAGVWDIFLPVAIGSYHGLFIEMKVGKNTLTPEQQSFRDYLWTHGYGYTVCYSWEQAKNAIISYLTC